MKKEDFVIGLRQAATFPGGFIQDTGSPPSPRAIGPTYPIPGDLLVEEDDKTFNAGKHHELVKEAFKIVYQKDCETILHVLEETAKGISSAAITPYIPKEWVRPWSHP